jgi:hypothetical protein
MGIKYLTPSYLDKNHRNTLRYELCEIVYSDYKGKTFFLDHQLRQKKIVLEKVYDFLNKHPEISEYKEDSKYWYPYENVDGSKKLSLYTEFYPNTEDEITYFCKKGEKEFDHSDYLLDPVKMHFMLMCDDIRTMDCDSDLAKEIIKINNEIFKVLFDTVGDTISYNGFNTLEHIEKYIKDTKLEAEKAKNDSTYSEELKDLISRDFNRFNQSLYALDDVIIICNENKLQKELLVKEESKKVKRKI